MSGILLLIGALVDSPVADKRLDFDTSKAKTGLSDLVADVGPSVGRR